MTIMDNPHELLHQLLDEEKNLVMVDGKYFDLSNLDNPRPKATAPTMSKDRRQRRRPTYLTRKRLYPKTQQKGALPPVPMTERIMGSYGGDDDVLWQESQQRQASAAAAAAVELMNASVSTAWMLEASMTSCSNIEDIYTASLEQHQQLLNYDSTTTSLSPTASAAASIAGAPFLLESERHQMVPLGEVREGHELVRDYDACEEEDDERSISMRHDEEEEYYDANEDKEENPRASTAHSSRRSSTGSGQGSGGSSSSSSRSSSRRRSVSRRRSSIGTSSSTHQEQSERGYGTDDPSTSNSSNNNNNDATLIEVCPGHFVPLVGGSMETWAAITNDDCQVVECTSCNTSLQCIKTCTMVLCEQCRDISPIHGKNTTEQDTPGLGLGVVLVVPPERQLAPPAYFGAPGAAASAADGAIPNEHPKEKAPPPFAAASAAASAATSAAAASARKSQSFVSLDRSGRISMDEWVIRETTSPDLRRLQKLLPQSSRNLLMSLSQSQRSHNDNKKLAATNVSCSSSSNTTFKTNKKKKKKKKTSKTNKDKVTTTTTTAVHKGGERQSRRRRRSTTTTIQSEFDHDDDNNNKYSGVGVGVVVGNNMNPRQLLGNTNLVESNPTAATTTDQEEENWATFD